MRHRSGPRVAGIRPAALVACSTLLLTVATACTSAGSKAGPERPATVLALAAPEPRGVPYTKDVEYFADRVATLTDGSVRLEIDYEPIPWTQASERELAEMVQEGETDLALVPTRVLDTLGITDFEALQTPMLIDTPELAGAVATGDIAADLLAGLDEHGLEGLGLVYEGLRRPLALNGAVTRASDFEGLLVRVPRSNVSDRLFAALEAVPDHGADHLVATNGEPYPLVETELALADTDFAPGSTVTTNMVLFPKYNAILANPDALGRLTDDQLEAVRQAAADTAAAATQTMADEEDLAATYCEVAGELVTASDDEVEAMVDLLQPVVDELRTDGVTAAAMDAIAELKQATVSPPFTAPPACAPPSGDSARIPSAPPAPTP